MAERLRILVLGWARLANQAREGSGYNLVASELSAGLAERGHEVVYLRSGMDFSPKPGFAFRERETWRDIRCFDAINSPNVAPAAVNFRNMEHEIQSPQHAAAVVRWARSVFGGSLPQIVHTHSLEGFGLDLIDAFEAAGVRTVVTPHNYWYVCPQVDLLRSERSVCFDYEGGRACASCLGAPVAKTVRRKRMIEQVAASLVGEKTAASLKHGFWLLRNRPKHGEPFEPGEADWSSGSPSFDSSQDPPLDDSESVAADANERFLARSSDGDLHLRVHEQSVYGRRRRGGVRTLGSASLVTPPSAFMASVYERMGVPPEKLRVVRLGLPHLDAIRGCVPDQRSGWQPEDDRPLRLSFLGTTRPNKGLHVLVRAIERLDPGVRTRCRITIRAAGEIGPIKRRLSRLSEVLVMGGYDVTDLPGMAADYDVGLLPHIWFENSPVVLLEHLHARRYVITSRLGGPAEWIQEGVNGSAVRAGDPEDLARAITGLVERGVPGRVETAPGLLSTTDQMIEETEACYRAVLGA